MEKTTFSNRPVSFTTSNEEHFNLFMKDVRRYKVLTAEEEKTLSATIKAGGMEGKRAHDKLVNSNLRLCITVAKQRLVVGADLADVIQYANIGLMKAARLYDGERGVRFSTFAVPFINDAITDGYMQQGVVRVTKHVRDAQRKYRKFEEKMLQTEGRCPTMEEFEDAYGITHEEAVAALGYLQPMTELDAPISSDADCTETVDSITPSWDDAYESVDYADEAQVLKMKVAGVLKSERKADLVFARLGIDGREHSWGELEMMYCKNREALQKEFGRSLETLKGMYPYMCA